VADWALMTVVRATCPRCGDNRVYARDVTVRCCDDTGRFAFRFRCPDCRMWMVKDAQDDAVMLLLGGGARTERWHLPLELFEYSGRGAPIDDDDLIAFHEAIERLPTASEDSDFGSSRCRTSMTMMAKGTLNTPGRFTERLRELQAAIDAMLCAESIPEIREPLERAANSVNELRHDLTIAA
jgi:hypothetical protein